jgi:hypothetical protein
MTLQQNDILKRRDGTRWRLTISYFTRERGGFRTKIDKKSATEELITE